MDNNRAHVRYSALSTQDDPKDRSLPGRSAAQEDLRYRFELPEEVPWKSIALALFLLAFGSLFLVISHFIYTQHMEGDSSQAYGFLVLGVLLFLPGMSISFTIGHLIYPLASQFVMSYRNMRIERRSFLERLINSLFSYITSKCIS